ncbi:uncharacterized protein LOC126381443 [Pectinophora gossypiella]|uniref:uncharacterized protein LOC126381443 n=1 Tax=Pectinophora gossypiella TaxID=13191 RepID=UPI00214EB8A6|nr:uncharacterized protein LOC126381443 [Pectinophora gossypiella]
MTTSRLGVFPKAKDPSPEICKVGIRVPPFWPEEPEIWFGQIEGQFANAGITSDTTKFNYVISNLDRQFSKEVKDLIIRPPATNKYEKLKAELIKRLSASHERKVKQLLMHEELGDHYLDQSPTETVLAAQPDASLEVLAELADRIQDIAPSTPQVAAASTSHAPGSSIDAVAKEVAELRKQLQNLTSQLSGRSRSRTRQQQRRRARSSSTRSQSNYRKFPVCFYHHKYGSQAHKCIRPCDFKAENSMGGR